MKQAPELCWGGRDKIYIYDKKMKELSDIENSYQWLEKTETQHRGTNQRSTRTGAKHKINRGPGSTTPDRTQGAGWAKRPLRRSPQGVGGRQIQTDKPVVGTQPDIVVVTTQHRKAVVIDVAIP
ncbi:unnamed protein product [Pleuronectes platessa]|uniref:Uncharacterized protein n=1 Tax=Pleuronectes platessa TaxID=8262 RepID=A0A9N7ZCE9_PLEPL|nr:unnamed protein product [Pleuronectes platessa]